MTNDVNALNNPQPTVLEGGRLEIDKLLAGIAKRSAPPLRDLSVALARQTYRRAMQTLDIAPVPGIQTVAERIEAAGHSVDVRISSPLHVDTKRHLLWVHGGGFCLGDAASTDAVCSWLALHTHAHVVSVDYRLAPEHPLPAALDDVITATRWAAARSAGAALTLGGESAGATLALAAAAELIEQEHVGINRLVLNYPMADLNISTPSRTRYEEGYFLAVKDLNWMLELAHAGKQACGRLNLLQRTHWPALPETLIVLTERDPLFDEGVQLAERLRRSGTEVLELRCPDLVHGALHMGGAIRAISQLHQYIATWLTRS